MAFSQFALPVHHHNVFCFTSLTAKPIRLDQRQQLATICCHGGSHHTELSRRDLIQSLLLVAMPMTSLSAQAAPEAGSLQTTSTSEAESALQQGVPAVLEGKAKLAVESALRKAVDKTKCPVVLRLVFHDSGTYNVAAGNGGANASIQHELERPENFGLKRGWKVIQQAMSHIQGTAAEGLVSQADMIALVGAYAVGLCGGPLISVPVGRVDAQKADATDRLPAEDFSADRLKQAFQQQGLSVQEFVALAGAHTLGSKGFGDPLTFDNAYFTALLQKPWAAPNADSMAKMIGLPSDHVLPDDSDCKPVIQMYAADQKRFFKDFADAYVKLTMLGAQWRSIAIV
ncbi:TPA: hypothetical protein ACH3X2_005396 [Trebouxia sp. C0005]|nr:MAG: L-ascorbate peroxidase [Trebouxia sp. A1-2]